MKNAWLLKKKEERTAEDALNYFKQLSRELAMVNRFTPPQEEAKPKFNVDDLFLPEVLQEAKKLSLEEKITNLQHEIAELQEYIIPKRQEELQRYQEQLSKM